MTAAPPTNQELATRYRCHLRTVQRMRTAGVDVLDPVAVAFYISQLRCPSTPMLERTIEILDELQTA